jgi:signal transduction histidine kinase
MAGGVAHEFNNLLGGILGCARQALDEDPAPDVREALEMIRKTADRGVGVTQALLRATSAEPHPEPCDVAALMEEALAEVRPHDGIEVVRDLSDATLRADAAMLRQVFSNLIRNAIEAMGESGRLELSAGADGGDVVVTIRDDGPGIESSVKAIVFEPFVTTRRGGREGVGLGLFLAERLVAAHAGNLSLESEPGEGTTFTIRIPSARDS